MPRKQSEWQKLVKKMLLQYKGKKSFKEILKMASAKYKKQ